MTHTAIVPRTKKKAPATRPGVRGAGVANAVRLKLLNNSAKGIELPNADFIAHVFAGISADNVPWLAGFPGDVSTADHKVWFGAPAFPLPRFVRPDHNNYICISTFNRAEDGKHRRRKDCWSGLWMVLLDDLGTKIPFTALRLAPSCLVETSPGNYQAWLFLKEPERDQLRAEALINGLIKAGASDPGAGNLTRYGRLPTGINGKAKYHDKNGQPFAQRTHIWEPSRRYTPEQIAQAHGFDLEAASKPQRRRTAPTKAAAKGNGYLSTLEAAGLYIEPIRGIEGGHRIACPWSGHHTGRDTSGTAYFEPADQNGMRGGFKCQHGHCSGRTIVDLDYFIQTLLRTTGRGAA
ncbi:MAG: DNA-primase RepB domain-containing protein [Zoogloea oleivorans]|jgi:hypothetical protein|uniref:DNA-primase RepB domain-containing protein n=1 Tax=Zoogloea oleivorans TaxID=1552750 RepID=UPI002A35DFD4|nr:DNA-primase RepB domain-containing protein [Zoogloea oleivorans]MDY0035069.1 DNA-primase RepB domain-containing protein [Zoogloea oleivorans]